ncbi:unnamed protein product [Medioppia subpectinata]|uniref:Uncharacterized protein n=1 Tax=Medioppia subpectinata TaxID=1979941 RepID=A0A7R9LSU7_9ACAR|nr:unnamed protein product [Medioppia subpectinata]CAG2120873.1 unnamed protein product [Medioppia subpectinata]
METTKKISKKFYRN